MKVIDLLNKIANGEEVPKKIIFNDIEWEYLKPQYIRVDRKSYENLWGGYNFNILNDEVEIIEEQQEDNFTGFKMFQNGKCFLSVDANQEVKFFREE